MLMSAPAEPPTGIRRTNAGGWAAVIDGKLAGSWSGLGSKLNAITCAGTNRVL